MPGIWDYLSNKIDQNQGVAKKLGLLDYAQNMSSMADTPPAMEPPTAVAAPQQPAPIQPAVQAQPQPKSLWDKLSEPGGDANTAKSLMNNPYLQMGMGILANNTGHYGSFAPAIGRGVIQGLGNYQDMQQQQTRQDIMNTQMETMRQNQINEQKRREIYGQLKLDDPASYKTVAQSMLPYDPEQAINLLNMSKPPAPIKLGQGETLLNPATYQPVAGGDHKLPEGMWKNPQTGVVEWIPNYISGKGDIAAAGRPTTTVSIDTGKKFSGTLAEGLAKQVDNTFASAQTARSTLQRSDEIKLLLESGNVITGPFAETRAKGEQVLSMVGMGDKDADAKLANTREVIRGLAQGQLDAAAQMRGQGQITDGERKLLADAAAGNINMTKAELLRLNDTMRKTALYTLQAHQQNVNKLRSIEGTDTVLPIYDMSDTLKLYGVTVPTNSNSQGNTPKPVATPAPNNPAWKVPPAVQQRRDTDRIGILTDELKANQAIISDPNATPVQRNASQSNVIALQAQLAKLNAQPKPQQQTTPQPTPKASQQGQVQALPMTNGKPDRMKMKAGTVYDTSNGPLRWNGKNYESVL
ncbi:hypothetical protein HQ393_04890 [Chitinibacter bivalviorum]|uniref:Uncharacterized protein n=1 Tax=Chitinibacter bivalviorum TaxID=2739434 RepID=A0A7H9BGW5_9NEIS|nr:hypothetical protein [Chitinibacter bivalviorum]QLG87642.1 hypothetical protein HQ393_04890 [Chitinibacter bivalviorum]